MLIPATLRAHTIPEISRETKPKKTAHPKSPTQPTLEMNGIIIVKILREKNRMTGIRKYFSNLIEKSKENRIVNVGTSIP